ncbi:hypothetical protein CVU37_14065 [candidate division BRC1 bacterium HGW-BRC1-1]|jgi:hypothetical protein|nr:MAG: hypothetical protein CVU37_14065 [candidate division BRC1 bacterium HGW-BRC1-1]
MNHETRNDHIQRQDTEGETQRVKLDASNYRASEMELAQIHDVFIDLAESTPPLPAPRWHSLDEALKSEMIRPLDNRSWRERYRTLRDSIHATDSPLLRAGIAAVALGILLIALALMWLMGFFGSGVAVPAGLAAVAIVLS